MNEGKIWEQDFKKAMTKSCVRLYDTTNGFAGVKNPCDFIYYNYPYQYMFELKSTKEDKLDFNHITDNQWQALDYFNKVYGMNPIIALQFRVQRKCFAIPFSEILETNKVKRSINITDCENNPNIKEIPARYKVTHCDIDYKVFTKILFDMAEYKAIHGGEK